MGPSEEYVPTDRARHDGVLAEGTFTAAHLVGPLARHPLSELLNAMRGGGTYVNADTNDGVPPVTNTPGDLSAGEIRFRFARRRPSLDLHAPNELRKSSSGSRARLPGIWSRKCHEFYTTILEPYTTSADRHLTRMVFHFSNRWL